MKLLVDDARVLCIKSHYDVSRANPVSIDRQEFYDLLADRKTMLDEIERLKETMQPARASLERIAEKADLKIAFLANDTLSDMNAALKYKSGRREKGNNKGHAQSKKSVNMNEPIKARVEQVISAEQRPLQPMTLYVAYNDDGQPVKQSDSEGMGELWNKNGYRVVAYRLDPNAS